MKSYQKNLYTTTFMDKMVWCLEFASKWYGMGRMMTVEDDGNTEIPILCLFLRMFKLFHYKTFKCLLWLFNLKTKIKLFCYTSFSQTFCYTYNIEWIKPTWYRKQPYLKGCFQIWAIKSNPSNWQRR